MAMVRWLMMVFICTNVLWADAQHVLFSDSQHDETESMHFEVVGKVGENILVYKKPGSKHTIGVYDRSMKLLRNQPLDFLPDKTFNVDVVYYPNHFYLIYQYHRNNRVYCMGVQMDANGERVSEPVQLDESRVGVFASRRIYTTVMSESRERILVYKTIRRKGELEWVARVFDAELRLTDSTEARLPYEQRYDIYGEAAISNDGTFILTHEKRRAARDNARELFLLVKQPNVDSLQQVMIPLDGNFIDEISIKIDNLNQRYVLNSLYSTIARGNIRGLFSAAVDHTTLSVSATAFNAFPDSIRERVSLSGNRTAAFNNLYLRNLVLKRDGGFVLNLEDFYMETIGNNMYRNRYDYLYGYPYSSYNDYYLYSPSYHGYYRPMHLRNRTTKYYFDNILVMDLNKNFEVRWHHLIVKRQTDTDTDNFLSFFNLITGNALHYLFLETERKAETVANYSVSGTGKFNRHATLKGSEGQYRFMPKLAKQISANEVVLPCLYRGYIVFAKVTF